MNCKSSVANRLRIAIHKLRYIHFLLYAAVFFSPPTLLSLMASHTAWTVFCCSRSLNMQLYKQSIRTQGEVNPTCSFKVAGHLGISLFRRAGVQVRLNSARIEQGKINSWQEVNIFHLSLLKLWGPHFGHRCRPGMQINGFNWIWLDRMAPLVYVWAAGLSDYVRRFDVGIV